MKIIDYSKDKEFLCMCQDAKLLHNLIDRKVRGYYNKDDYIQPGLLSGQSLGEILEIIIESITNHLNSFEKKGVSIL